MQGRTAARAVGVSVLVLTLALASQLLAADTGQGRRDRRGRASTSTTVVAPVESTQPESTQPESTQPTTTTSTIPPPRLTGPVRLVASTRIDGHGLGPVESGMTAGKGEQTAGRRFTFTGRRGPSTACFKAEVDGLPGLRFAIKGPVADPRDGVIVRTEVTEGDLATVSGIRVGATLAEVRATYRGRARETKATGGGVVLTVPVPDGNQRFGVAMVTSSREVVTAIYSGSEAALADLSGCG